MIEKITIAWLAIKELGLRQLWFYGLYRLGLLSGYYRRLTPVETQAADASWPADFDLFTLPSPAQLMAWRKEGSRDWMGEAEEICKGKVRLFGEYAVDLDLSPAGTQAHWSRATWRGRGDVKLVWEPARFGWAFTLGRAYQATGNESFANRFWQFFECFYAANPVNCGPNWESAQEVALRLIALVFSGQVFKTAKATSPERMALLTAAIRQHARRIPPTMVYARAQNNNHLLSEAAGLYLAGVIMKKLPEAARWRETGWRWLNHGLQKQILADGAYIQHSLNYHRLMLQLALVACAAARRYGNNFPAETLERLAAATRWYIAAIDSVSGGGPNLGHNDGALLLPFEVSGFRDHRATAQAAARAFLGSPFLAKGAVDELSAWLGLDPLQQAVIELADGRCGFKRLGDRRAWATMRAERFQTRPGQADQLHVDLWYEGVNLIKDPGTYAYNLPAPWDNGLASASVHNAPFLDGKEPMRRAGRFLWLDWDQAQWLEQGSDRQVLAAERFGYRKLGIRHLRELVWHQPGRWEVVDSLLPIRVTNRYHRLQMSWLLADADWKWEENELSLRLPGYRLLIKTQISPDFLTPEVRLVRGGEVVHGSEGEFPLHGWYSPTYLVREPALSLVLQLYFSLPVKVTTRFLIEIL